MEHIESFTHAGVEVRHETVTIRTYRDGLADPNPPLFSSGMRTIYPYTWRKSFTTDIEDREYDAIVVTSPWMEVSVLPDWGKHVCRA